MYSVTYRGNEKTFSIVVLRRLWRKEAERLFGQLRQNFQSRSHPIHYLDYTMADGNQSPTKRKRGEGSPEESTPYVRPVQRSDIWYDDGNIVLQAESYQFKVYRGVLAESSTVFKDMLSLPQPPSKETDLVEGCPVIHLSDTWRELRWMLRSILRRG